MGDAANLVSTIAATPAANAAQSLLTYQEPTVDASALGHTIVTELSADNEIIRSSEGLAVPAAEASDPA